MVFKSQYAMKQQTNVKQTTLATLAEFNILLHC